MEVTQDELKERIKELTCMYEVTSVIVNSDYKDLEASLEAIAECLRRAFQHQESAYVRIQYKTHLIEVGEAHASYIHLEVPLRVFDRESGSVAIHYPSHVGVFLEEESTLLTTVSMEIGNLIERKQIKENQERIRKQMERSDRLTILGEITAGIAHELNTPLTNIIGFTELLDEQISDHQVQSDLSKIKGSALFCREIVKKLMFFACEVPQQMESISVYPVLKGVLDLLAPTFRKKHVCTELAIEDKGIVIKADEIQLTQVLFNIIMNALYYSPPKSTVLIKAREEFDGIRIFIEDQGIGIAPSIADKVYEPFFTTKEVGEGSGLGLSVVHGIMNSHKGRITFYTNTPTGTVFELWFPK